MITQYLHFYRVEKVAIRHFLPVRANFGHLGRAKPEDERSGLCYLQGGQQRLQCAQIHAGISVL